MKRLFLLPVAAGLFFSSCDTNTKDSTAVQPFGEYNLIVSENTQDPASVSSNVYNLSFNLTKGAVAVSTEDLVFANTKHSFETDTIPYSVYVYKDQDGNYFDQGKFSRAGNSAKPNSPSITRLSAMFTGACHYVTTPVPGFVTPNGVATRLILDYTYNDSYRIRTFWPECFYRGTTTVTGEGGHFFSTTSTVYRIVMDMEKLTAQCVIYSPEYAVSSGAATDTSTPTAILLSEIPVKFTHDLYYLEASAPKTQILKSGSTSWAESDAWKASDFRFDITSTDLTQGVLKYKIGDWSILSSGSSIVIPSF